MSDLFRYMSQVMVPEVGSLGQQHIEAARLLVIGAGGLGCPALQYLVGMGVGNIGIVDDDTVSITNMPRQILYTEQDVGRLKVDVAKERLQRMNSRVTIDCYAHRLNAGNARQFLKLYDLVIDCSDNIDTRYIIDEACCDQCKPFVYAGVRHFEGQVSVFNYDGGPSFSTVFPDRQQFELVADCATAGTLGHTVGLIACLQVNEALKIILHRQDSLSGYLLTIDLLTLIMRKLKLRG